jgi:predicted GTPase
MTGDIILNNFNHYLNRFKIKLITVFNKENTDNDYNGKYYYARLYSIEKMEILATHLVVTGDTEEEVIEKLPKGMKSVGKNLLDPKEIIRSYM